MPKGALRLRGSAEALAAPDRSGSGSDARRAAGDGVEGCVDQRRAARNAGSAPRCGMRRRSSRSGSRSSGSSSWRSSRNRRPPRRWRPRRARACCGAPTRRSTPAATPRSSRSVRSRRTSSTPRSRSRTRSARSSEAQMDAERSVQERRRQIEQEEMTGKIGLEEQNKASWSTSRHRMPGRRPTPRPTASTP